MESSERTHHSDDDKEDKAVEEVSDRAETSDVNSVGDDMPSGDKNLDMEPTGSTDANGTDSDNGNGNGNDNSNDNDNASNSSVTEKKETEIETETAADHEGAVVEQERESSPVPSGIHDTIISNQESTETYWEDAKFDHEESLVTAHQLANGTDAGVGDGEDEFSFEVRDNPILSEDRAVMDITPVPPLEAVRSIEQEKEEKEEENEGREEGQEVERDVNDEDTISNSDDVATVKEEAPAGSKHVKEASPVAEEQIESGGDVYTNDINNNHEDTDKNTSEEQEAPGNRIDSEEQAIHSGEISDGVKDSEEETKEGESSDQLGTKIVEQEGVGESVPHTPDSQGSKTYFVQTEETTNNEVGTEVQGEQEIERVKSADLTPQTPPGIHSRPPPPDLLEVPPKNLPENATVSVGEDQTEADEAASPPLPPRSPRSPRSRPTEGPFEDVRIDNMVTKQPRRKHNVPPPLSEEMKNATFRKNFTSLRPPAISSPRSPTIDTAADINLIVNRFLATSQQVDHETASRRQNITEGQYLLKENYTNILESGQGETEVELGKASVSKSPTLENPEIVVSGPEGITKVEGVEEEDEEIKVLSNINWAFWTSVVNDFGMVAQQNADELEREISKGIPSRIRGIIWQLIANSKSKEFEDIYYTLLDTPSPHEMSIRRDLQRTNFIPKERFDSLFNVMKVYSIYGPDVGYTQGMGFITTPLLLNCENEADALGLLIVLMKNYNLRDLFLSEMPGLMLLLYQFDRLLEENSPMLYNHLSREGIRSSMYATQWFLTFFAYKFPLGFVLRIFDIVFFEGIESILKFAVNLMLKNKDTILNLKFDQLLNFLKNDLFEFYSVESIEKRKSGTFYKHDVNSSTSVRNFNRVNHDTQHISTEYNIDLFVSDAMNDVHITPISLHRYSAEYREISELRHQREIEYEMVRIKNHQLKKESMKLKHNYNLLNKEHIVIANELIEVRLKLETLLDENHDLKSTVTQLGKQIQEEHEKAELPNPDAKLQSDLRLDLRRTRERAAEVMDENKMLHRRIRDLKILIRELREENEAKVMARYPIYQTSERPAGHRASHGSIGEMGTNNNSYNNGRTSFVDAGADTTAGYGGYSGDITGSHLDVPRRSSAGRRSSSESGGSGVAAAFNKGWSGFKKAFRKEGP